MESIFNLDNKYEFISLDRSSDLADYCHAAHCCIYSRNSFTTVESLESKAYISMQMRFDGRLGFPGGIVKVESGSSQWIVDGLNRELSEEMNLDKKYFANKKNYCYSNYCRESKWCFHFFTIEVSVENFLDIERNVLDAEDYGQEVLGIIRVPLFVMEDNVRGLPAFLSNNFAGCAKEQLLNFLAYSKLMPYDDIKECLLMSQS